MRQNSTLNNILKRTRLYRVLLSSSGDLIIDGMPVIDYAAGGSAVELIATIDTLLRLDFDTSIPGHGRLMTRDVSAFETRIPTTTRRRQRKDETC